MSTKKQIVNDILRRIKRAYIKERLEIIYGIKSKIKGSFKTIIDKERKYTLFITHDLGGGTKNFEEIYLKNKKNILILRRLGYEFMEDRYFMIELNNRKFITIISNIKKMIDLEYDEIIINSLVGYRHKKEIIDGILNYKKFHAKCVVRYLVHDYDCICPSKNLYMDGKYCELACAECNLELNYANRKPDIIEWRNIWKRLLYNIDEIRCFSDSSKLLLKRIYNDLDNENISVIPHDTSYINKNPISINGGTQMCLGFIGNISSGYKGNQVVKEVIKQYGDKVDIRLIGSNRLYYGLMKRKKVKILGSYNRDNLRNILINEKVTISVFPSVWPETFSYLVSELISLDIPVICFDIGAQAEKVKKYNKGIVCKNQEEMFSIIDRIYMDSLKG